VELGPVLLGEGHVGEHIFFGHVEEEGGATPRTEAERLRCLGIQAMAIARMAAGEAPA
jgi:hypothetical protein